MKKNIFDYLFLCHKIPSRTFHYRGNPFPICSRCTGIFIGYIIATILLILSIFFPLFLIRFWISIILLIPMLLDGGIQYFTHYESNNIKRLITGLLGGIGIVFFLYYVVSLGIAHGRWMVEHVFH